MANDSHTAQGAEQRPFARGINRIQMHSFSYSPPGIPAPGWRMYAEIHLNRNTPWWPELKPLCTWITRNQFVLQSGFPVADALIYPVKSNPVDGPFNVSGDQPWTAINAVDGTNPYVLAELAKRDSKTPYLCKQIIIRDEIATLAEARHLLTLVDRGMTLWCCHTMPDQWQAMKDSDRDEVKRLQDRLQRAKDQGRVRDACRQSWQDVVASHQSVQCEGTGKISFQHRRVQGAEVYLVSSWEEPFRGQISFPHADLVPEIWMLKRDRPVRSRTGSYAAGACGSRLTWKKTIPGSLFSSGPTRTQCSCYFAESVVHRVDRDHPQRD